MKYLGQITDDEDIVNKKYVDDASEVVQTLTSGTKIGSVGGTDLYAPTGGGGGVQTTWFGTSSTDASTSIKVVTCAGFTLTAGAIIGIQFSTGSTASTPALDVNNTGTKSIYIGSTVVSSNNPLKWSTNTLLYFQYDGTYFKYIKSATTWYTTCNTAADTSPKEITLDNFVYIPGSLITVRFTNGINRSATTLMTINGVSIGNIERKWAGISSSNSLVCAPKSQLTFMYSGSYVELISVDDQEHPVGSCYTTSTNTNPSTYFGGTWELIHKQFTSAWVSDAYTFNTTNTTDGAGVCILNGNTIEFRLTWKNKVALSDTSISIATIDMSKIGLTAGNHTVYSVAWNDGCNAIGMASVSLSSTTGTATVTMNDWVTRATSYPTTTGENCYLNFVTNCRVTTMSDNMCDEFIWKRTA